MASRTWYCAAVAVKVETIRKGNVFDHNICVQQFPFAVTAGTYHEALGMATVTMEAVKARLPGYTYWCVKVNNLAEGGLITDPEDVKLHPA